MTYSEKRNKSIIFFIAIILMVIGAIMFFQVFCAENCGCDMSGLAAYSNQNCTSGCNNDCNDDCDSVSNCNNKSNCNTNNNCNTNCTNCSSGFEIFGIFIFLIGFGIIVAGAASVSAISKYKEDEEFSSKKSDTKVKPKNIKLNKETKLNSPIYVE